MSSHWASCPLIGHHVLWLVIMSADWSSCPLIGHHVLSLGIMFIMASLISRISIKEIPSSKPLTERQTCAILQMLSHLKTIMTTDTNKVMPEMMFGTNWIKETADRVYNTWDVTRNDPRLVPHVLTCDRHGINWIFINNLLHTETQRPGNGARVTSSCSIRASWALVTINIWGADTRAAHKDCSPCIHLFTTHKENLVKVISFFIITENITANKYWLTSLLTSFQEWHKIFRVKRPI